MNNPKNLTAAQFQILLSLADKPKHGYAIMQEVNAIPNNRVRLGPGTLYGNLKKMKKNGLISEKIGYQSDEQEEANERRRYYELTQQGRKSVIAEARNLSQLVEIAHAKQLLNGAA